MAPANNSLDTEHDHSLDRASDVQKTSTRAHTAGGLTRVTPNLTSDQYGELADTIARNDHHPPLPSLHSLATLTDRAASLHTQFDVGSPTCKPGVTDPIGGRPKLASNARQALVPLSHSLATPTDVPVSLHTRFDMNSPTVLSCSSSTLASVPPRKPGAANPSGGRILKLASNAAMPSFTNPVISLPSHRQQRYTLAEQALVRTFQRCAEPNPADQQILSLQRATRFLSAQATQAQERAAKLRAALAKRDAEPEDFRAMQCERWLEERRATAREDQRRAVEGCLEKLLSDRRAGGNSAHAHAPHALGNVTSDRPSHAQPPCQSPSPRRRTNLAHFFEFSPTRTPIAGHARATAHARSGGGVACIQYYAHANSPSASTRRRVITHVRSLRLRNTACVLALKNAHASEARKPSANKPKSQGGVSPREVRSEQKVGPSSTVSPSTSTSGSRHPQPPPSPALPLRAADARQRQMSAPTLSPSISMTTPSASTSTLASHTSQRGTAHIFRDPEPRTRAEILAALEAEPTAMPAYAVDLLDELVRSELDVSLRAPQRRQSTKARDRTQGLKESHMQGHLRQSSYPNPTATSSLNPYSNSTLRAELPRIRPHTSSGSSARFTPLSSRIREPSDAESTGTGTSASASTSTNPFRRSLKVVRKMPSFLGPPPSVLSSVPETASSSSSASARKDRETPTPPSSVRVRAGSAAASLASSAKAPMRGSPRSGLSAGMGPGRSQGGTPSRLAVLSFHVKGQEEATGIVARVRNRLAVLGKRQAASLG